MSGDNPVLPEGDYVYPFQFKLPLGLPTSFEGTYGHIRYLVKATIDRPWKFDHKTIQPLTINEQVDLNTMSNARVSAFFIDNH